MRRAQRYRITKAIADALVRQTFDDRDVDLYLRAFGIETPHDYGSFGNTRETYVMGTVAVADNSAILEMAEDLGVSAFGLSAAETPPKIWPDKKLFRLFISHISKDKEKATRLRDCLTPFFISGFVAHQDIHPTALWQVEIERALHAMDAFLAIHTDGFSKSVWTQQEIGFAVARGVKIISFKMGEDPTGFISRHQALPRLKRKAEAIAKEVHQLLADDDATKRRLAEAVAANAEKPDPDEIPF